MLAGKRILLTGGAGFIGTHLCRALCEDNQLVVLDTLRRNALEPAGLADHANIELRQGDVRQLQDVQGAMQGCSHVVHLASIAGVDTVIGHPVTTMQVNLLGASNVLEAARELLAYEPVVDLEEGLARTIQWYRQQG